MSTEQQVSVDTEAKPVTSLTQDQDTSAVGENPQVATSTETPAAGEHQQEEPNATSTPSSPKHGSNILANFPTFLKKPFEKKQETTEPGDQAVTETSDEAAATSPPNQDKSEKRLSRTLMDMLHKTKAKPSNQSEPADNEADVTTGVLSEEQTEGEQATGSEVPATGSSSSSPKDTKEPIMEHLRKMFAKKPSDSTPTATDSTTTPTATAAAATHDNDAGVEEGDHPTVPTDQSATTEDSKPTSLSRRLSKMAQNLTTRIKETNKKQQPHAAKTTSGEGDTTIESTSKPTTDENAPEEQSSAAPATTHTADVEATNAPLPESVSNNGNGLPVPASA